jgi:hypothetical protein
MNKERILIAQDNSLLNDICSDLRQFKPLLEGLKTIYESLEIGDFSPQIYGEIVYSGTSEISKRFRASIESDIKKMGVSKSIIKENITSGAETLLNQFEVYVNELKKFRPETFSRQQKLNLKCISYNEKGFVITSDDKEDILESCRIYIETDVEHELYEALLKFIDAFDEFDKKIVEMGIVTNPMANKLGAVAELFLIPENGKYKVKPESISWAINRKNYLESSKGNH